MNIIILIDVFYNIEQYKVVSMLHKYIIVNNEQIIFLNRIKHNTIYHIQVQLL